MKLYKITIMPTSNFSTTLKGDTLFGQMCWSIIYISGEKRLKDLLTSYEESPFLVVSDGFTSGYLPKPKMTSALLGEESVNKKANRKKIWLRLDELKNGEYSKVKTNEEANHADKNSVTIRNSIDYKSFGTGDSDFAPYGNEEVYIGPKDIYFLIDEDKFSFEELKEVFVQLSQNGYGKDTTIGKGRFELKNFEEVKINNNSKTFMTLSPFSVKNLECKNIYYETFTRFGKFGAGRAFKNAFKKPILLADSASVVHFEKMQNIQYIGSSIKNVSQIYDDTVHQGYSIVVPIGEIS